MVHEAEVTSDSALKTYIGMSAPDFKSRYGNHHDHYDVAAPRAV